MPSSVVIFPLTVTHPVLIYTSASRREHTPELARKRFNLIFSSGRKPLLAGVERVGFFLSTTGFSVFPVGITSTRLFLSMPLPACLLVALLAGFDFIRLSLFFLAIWAGVVVFLFNWLLPVLLLLIVILIFCKGRIFFV